MAMLGEIGVGFFGRFDRLERGFKQAEASVRRGTNSIIRNADRIRAAGAKMQSIGRGLTVGVTAPIIAATAAVGAFSLKAIKAGDEIKLMSDKASLSTDTIQELAYAGDVAGTSLQSMVNASGRFAKVIGDAERGLSTATDALDNLGISIRDSSGAMRTQDALFFEAIEKLRGLKDETAQMALAQEAFGRGGREMLPILKLSADEFANLRNRAHDLGAVLSNETVKALDDIDSNLSTFKTGLQGAGNVIIESLVPHLERLVDWLNDSVVPAIKTVAERVAGWIDWFANLTTGTQVLIGSVAALAVAIGPVTIAFGALLQVLPGVTAAVASLNTGIVVLNTTINTGLLVKLGAAVAAFGAVALWAKAVYDQVANIHDEIGKVEPWQTLAGGLKRIHEMEPVTVEASVAVQEAADAISAAGSQLEEASEKAGKSWAELINPVETFEQKVMSLGQSIRASVDEQFATSLENARQKLLKETLPAVIRVPDAMADHFELAGEHAIREIDHMGFSFRQTFGDLRRSTSELASGLMAMFPPHTVVGRFAQSLRDINSTLSSMASIARGITGLFNTIFGSGGGGGAAGSGASIASTIAGFFKGGGGGAAGAGAGAAATAGSIAVPAALPVGTLAPAASIGSTGAAGGGGAAGAAAAAPAAAIAAFTLASLVGVKALGGNPGQIFDRNPFSNFGRGPSTEELIERERQRVRESGYGGIPGRVDRGWGGRTRPSILDRYANPQSGQGATVIVNVNGSVYGDDGKEQLYDEILQHVKMNGG